MLDSKSMKILLPLLISIVFFVPNAWSAGKTVTLKDGSRINGQIVGMKNGSYILRSAVGEIAVPEDSVTSITAQDGPLSQNTPAAQSKNSAMSAQIQAVQGQMLSDPAILNDIQALAQDPDMIAALSDPAFIQAVQNQDLQTIEASPRFQKLMNNPGIRALMGKMAPSVE